jgi:hypothetical protein
MKYKKNEFATHFKQTKTIIIDTYGIEICMLCITECSSRMEIKFILHKNSFFTCFPLLTQCPNKKSYILDFKEF